MLHRRSYPQEAEDDTPPEPDYIRQRRRVMAALVHQGTPFLQALKQIAEEQAAKFYVPLPTKTEDDERQYRNYKMVSDVLEMLFVQVHEEAQVGMSEAQEQHYQQQQYMQNAQQMQAQNYGQQYGNEGQELWTTVLKRN